MTLDEVITLITATSNRMNDLYKQTVFDEWAVVALVQHKARLLGYIGPRKEDFQNNFINDIRDLRADLLANKHSPGEFEFARHGFGTKVEAFVVLSEGIFLLCNNTTKTMSDITKDPLWLSAQVPFVEMSDRFRSEPLVYPL